MVNANALANGSASDKPVLVAAPPRDQLELTAALQYSAFRAVPIGCGMEETAREPRAIAALISDAVPSALTLCRKMAVQRPVILLSSNNEFAFRLAAARAGIRALLRRPVDPVELLNCLDEIEPSLERGHMSVVLVDDDRIGAELSAEILRSAGFKVAVVHEPTKAVEIVEQVMPDLILLDLHMPGVDGIELAAVIRLLPHLVAIPLIFLSGEGDAVRQNEARLAGGEDFIQKPIDPKRLIAQVKMRAVRARTLRAMSERDDLTGLLGRARFQERLEHAMASSDPEGHGFSVAVIDVDHFKIVNDTHGHPVGDQILRTLARVLTTGLRRSDLVARCGGEEFCALLAAADPSEARETIDRVRERFGEATSAIGVRVTFSAGVAGSRMFRRASDLVQAADQAMYIAKAGGRNRVERHLGSPSAR